MFFFKTIVWLSLIFKLDDIIANEDYKSDSEREKKIKTLNKQNGVGS